MCYLPSRSTGRLSPAGVLSHNVGCFLCLALATSGFHICSVPFGMARADRPSCRHKRCFVYIFTSHQHAIHFLGPTRRYLIGSPNFSPNRVSILRYGCDFCELVAERGPVVQSYALNLDKTEVLCALSGTTAQWQSL